ncbi:c-type cytochrome [Sandarakinorhabdus rubra]|uniref:c-type cytochrome n=1 Tax=Sandarakinorhabdus rubra TaxID=2672568 RepID=UPI0013DB2960|nr:c-type cytochrome [Sandarakinorhabdus rubra]
MRGLRACLTVAPVAAAVLAAATPASAADGAALYAQRCGRCHAMDRNGTGPSHAGLVGRKAGKVPGYAYSPALAAVDFTWTPEALDRWLAGPQAMVPGAKMYFRVANPAERAAIIAWLARP